MIEWGGLILILNFWIFFLFVPKKQYFFGAIAGIVLRRYYLSIVLVIYTAAQLQHSYIIIQLEIKN